MRGTFCAVAALAMSCVTASATEKESTPVDAAPGGVAVAPFVRSTSPGVTAPDVDALLADRIGTRGVERVVGPGQMDVGADAEPDSATVQRWARDAEVGSVVVGRITRLGDQISVDVRVRSGETGEVVDTFVAEAPATHGIEVAVEKLADDVLGAIAAAPAPEAAASAAAAPAGGDNSFGIDFDSSSPISIRSDELEAVQNDGARQLVFTRNVVVTQDDVTIRSARLEAYYPPNASQPERLVAQGGVRMRQGAREARCDNATFERSRERFVCRGDAELRDAESCVAGEEIEFDLAADTAKVKGGARVMINGADGSAAGACR